MELTRFLPEFILSGEYKILHHAPNDSEGFEMMLSALSFQIPGLCQRQLIPWWRFVKNKTQIPNKECSPIRSVNKISFESYSF